VRVWTLSVGRPGPLLAPAISEYELRAGRYWTLSTLDVREERAASLSPAQVRTAEARRLSEKLPAGVAAIALTRTGQAWSSAQLAEYLQDLAERGRGAAFLIGGAFGLADELLDAADEKLSLSPLTLPHEVARLLIAEQLYRAGTILRGQPYHKARQ
jgi:23S rRNA (pseudouridine1915-N3)-methyltransferase